MNIGVDKDLVVNPTISGIIAGAGDRRDGRASIDDPVQDYEKMLWDIKLQATSIKARDQKL